MRLDFIHGIRLADPSGILQGQLLSKRYVPLETIAEAERPAIETLIREAGALDPTTWAEPAPAADTGRAAASSELGVTRRGRRG